MLQSEKVKIGAIGAGSWGTTLANLLADKGHTVDLWVREDEVYEQIKSNRINETFLPGMRLVDSLNPVKTFEEALKDKDVIMMVVPSHVYRDVLIQMKPFLKPGVQFISATKGIENNTLKVMSEVAEEILEPVYTGSFACLAGPSFANEVVVKQPTAVTIASRDIAYAARLQSIFSTSLFRVYVSDDLTGIQLCGALKNIIAIAAGISDGLGFGLNARAALITRGLAEITRLGVAMGANPMTFAGLSGIGDLVLTCTGDLSRNRTLGLKIGKGMKLAEITGSMSMVAEGVKTSIAACELGKKMGVELPITDQVYETLYRDKNPLLAVKELMTRELKKEREH
ncbi:MAG: NAD(P)-dependent glycerol-3-phosphate dehydrogenase [Deltaproteobacteria bacterium]|nr:NAD(P)-dependent glycerol-3-phosphate dehydrogenase [Deltaproteobacteria bacterium]